MVKLKGGGSQTENMLRAQEEGSKAVARGSEAVVQQRNISTQAGAQAGLTAVQTAMQYRGQSADIEAQKAQQAEQTAARQGHQDIQQQGLELEAAQAGIMTPRQRELEEKMARGKSQTEKTDLGYGGADAGYTVNKDSPVQQMKAAQVSANETNAAASYLNAQNNLAKAQLAGDKEGRAAAMKTLGAPLKSRTNQLNDLMTPKSELRTSELMGNLKSEWKSVPDPALQQELASGIPGERTVAMLRQAQSMEALKYVSATGELPDSKDFDSSSPTMQRYFKSIETVSGMMKSFGGGQLASWAGIKTQEQKNQFTQKLAAWMVSTGQDQAMARPPAAARGVAGAQPGSSQQQPAPAPGGAAPTAGGGQQQPPARAAVNTGQMDERILRYGAGGKR
jgi:hypothetical protein